MKKLTLTFCATFALFVVAAALYADGPERVSSKEKEVMQPAPPVCDFYRAHEWDLSIWAAWAFAADDGQHHVDDIDPFVPDNDPFVFDYGTYFYGEPKIYNPNERVNIGQVSKNEIFGRDDTWGGGVDVKYFWSKYFGVGVEGLGLAADTNFAGGGLLTMTARFPFGRFSPYVTGGLGFITGGSTLYKYFNEKHTYFSVPQFYPANDPRAGQPNPNAGTYVANEREYWTVDSVNNHQVRALGQIGVGLEFRATCHIGLMADFTWNFVFGQDDHSDKFHTITQQGVSQILFYGQPVFTSITINQASELKPGHGSDHQDFGMVRFGVTFSY